MANEKHLKILKKGVKVWNKWREENPKVEPDLSKANLKKAKLSRANLDEAFLHKTNFKNANLKQATLVRANLCDADLRKADLKRATLKAANLHRAILNKAKLNGADLDRAVLVETKLKGADLSGCRIYGISAWNLDLDESTTKQENLIIFEEDESIITVDNLEVAQFIYLLLNNEKIRNVIDSIGKKGVLILGRFTKERKAVLDAIREKLRELSCVPMMFDFEKPKQRDFTETIKTLAGLSRFIIADITDPKSIPLEMQAIVPDFMVPLVPIIQEPQKPFAMIQDLQQKCDWVFDVIAYDSEESLIGALEKEIVQPAKKMADKLLSKRGKTIRMRRLKDDI